MLTGLELTFMGVTWSNLFFSVLQVLLSHLWEKEKGEGRRKKKKGRAKKVIEKERKEERSNKE